MCRFESAEMSWRLHDCGVPAKLLMYSKDSHADFAIDWRPLQGDSSPAGPALVFVSMMLTLRGVRGLTSPAILQVMQRCCGTRRRISLPSCKARRTRLMQGTWPGSSARLDGAEC